MPSLTLTLNWYVAEQEATHPIDEESILKVIEENESRKYKDIGLSRQNAEQENGVEVDESQMQPLTTREKIMHLDSVIQFLDDDEERIKNDLHIIRDRFRQSLLSKQSTLFNYFSSGN